METVRDRLETATDEWTGEVREDALFFAHFTVPLRSWQMYCRIENRGYVYWHRRTIRPLFIQRLLTLKPPHRLHGYAWSVQLDATPTGVNTANKFFHPEETDEEISHAMMLNLQAIDDHYTALGEYASDDALIEAGRVFGVGCEFAWGEFDDEPRRILTAARHERKSIEST